MYYEILMEGENYKRLFSFSLHHKNRSWMYLKLEKLQDITNGEYTSQNNDSNHPEGSYFNNLWLARRSRQGDTYLYKPFGSDGNLVLDETDEITDLMVLP